MITNNKAWTGARSQLSFSDVAHLVDQLTTAERERDEARRERDAVRKQYAMSLEEQVELVRQREGTSSQLWDCMNERDAWKHRAERAEQAAVNVITSFISGRDCGESPCGYGKAAGISPEFCMCRKEASEELAEAVRALDAKAQP